MGAIAVKSFVINKKKKKKKKHSNSELRELDY